MKKRFLLCFFLFVSVFSFAQTPQLFNYQGVARDLTGNPLPDKAIGLRISIFTGAPTVTTKYTETHSVTTNELGLFNIQIGEGNTTFGTFQDINWGASTYFLQVEIDENADGNYQVAGVSQLLSVPYALYAKDVENDRDNQMLSINGSTLTISEGNTISIPSNNQLLSVNGNELSISEGNTVALPTGADDQTLSVNGNDLTISEGNTVSLPTSADDQTLSLNGNELTISEGNTVSLPSGGGSSSPAFQQFIPLGPFSILRGAVSGPDGNNIIVATNNGTTFNGIRQLEKDTKSGQFYWNGKGGAFIDQFNSMVVLGDFVYVLSYGPGGTSGPNVFHVTRINLVDSGAGEMNIVGAAISPGSNKPMFSNGTQLVIHNASDNWIKFDISGNDLINAGTLILPGISFQSAFFDGEKVYTERNLTPIRLGRMTPTGTLEETIERGFQWHLFNPNQSNSSGTLGIANIDENRLYIVSTYDFVVNDGNNTSNAIIVLTPFSKP